MTEKLTIGVKTDEQKTVISFTNSALFHDLRPLFEQEFKTKPKDCSQGSMPAFIELPGSQQIVLYHNKKCCPKQVEKLLEELQDICDDLDHIIWQIEIADNDQTIINIARDTHAFFENRNQDQLSIELESGVLIVTLELSDFSDYYDWLQSQISN